jgi:hypothetical protein
MRQEREMERNEGERKEGEEQGQNIKARMEVKEQKRKASSHTREP